MSSDDTGHVAGDVRSYVAFLAEHDRLTTVSGADPARDIEVVDGCWSTPIDPTIPPERRERGDYTNTRAIIDATRPYHWREEFPGTTKMTDELRTKLEAEWGEVLFGAAGD